VESFCIKLNLNNSITLFIHQMFTITLYYRSKVNSHLSIETPPGFQWIGRGVELDTGIRDWQIEGNDIEVVSTIVLYCEEQVLQNKIEKDYEIVITRE